MGVSVPARLAPLVSALVDAHGSGIPFSAATVEPPATPAEAVAVQAAVAHVLDGRIAGWKVGFMPAADVPVAAPLFQHLLLDNGGAYDPGGASFVAVEVEIGFRLQTDLAAETPRSALGPAFVGIEIIRSRLEEAAGAPFMAFLADNIGNGAYVVGPQRRDWAGLDLPRLRCRLRVDGTLLHDARGGHPQGDPTIPVEAISREDSDPFGGIRAGQIVTTGTLTGVVAVAPPCTVTAELEEFGEVSVRIES